jgi:3-oxoacyl-[acyl-carrier protein] reductase
VPDVVSCAADFERLKVMSSPDVAIGSKIHKNGQRRVTTADGNPDFDLSTGITGAGKRKRTIMGKLDEKVAIVTGAARGLGRAYAKRLAALGAKVAVADLNLRSYEEFEAEAKDMTADTTVAEIEAAGGAAMGIELDVRDHEAVEAMVGRVVQEWGRVDVLVANAGGGRGRPMDTRASALNPALLQLVVEMNLFGTVYSCNSVAPIMKQQRSGKIITVSSVAGVGTVRR